MKEDSFITYVRNRIARIKARNVGTVFLADYEHDMRQLAHYERLLRLMEGREVAQ